LWSAVITFVATFFRNLLPPFSEQLLQTAGFSEIGTHNLTMSHLRRWYIISYHTISFIFIPWIRTGLKNPYGYGNHHICLRSQEFSIKV